MQQTHQGVGAGNWPGDSEKDQRQPLETEWLWGGWRERMNATQRSEQQKDAEKEWSWLREGRKTWSEWQLWTERGGERWALSSEVV